MATRLSFEEEALRKSGNGMVRPCSCPASDKLARGAKTGARHGCDITECDLIKADSLGIVAVSESCGATPALRSRKLRRGGNPAFGRILVDGLGQILGKPGKKLFAR